MKIICGGLEGILIIQPRIFEDERGHFVETFSTEKLPELPTFVQDNESKSVKGTLRGLHYQTPPHAQGKLVRVVVGEILDVAVDIRCSSPTFGKCFIRNLTCQSKEMVYIPQGFAHGFVTLSSEAIFAYKCTQSWNKESERGILWNDPDLEIPWGVINPILSKKDQKNLSLAELQGELEQWSIRDWEHC